MLEVQGKCNKAKIFTDNVDSTTISQIIELCNQEFTTKSKIRIMPDCHAGAGCVIGTVMTIQDKIVPNLVGVDIGCGVLCANLGKINLDLKKIDDFIREKIPHGFNINRYSKANYKKEIESLYCLKDIGKVTEEYNRAIGSLGGGNHFIELDEDDEKNKYLIIHSGSRNLGNRVAKCYQKKAYDYYIRANNEFEEDSKKLIEKYKKENREDEIQDALIRLKKEHNFTPKIPKDLCYLEGKLMEDYLHDMDIIQKYAELNRYIMAKRIIEECIGIKFNDLEHFQTIHNYIEIENKILRKGAIAAYEGRKLLIPINMRDGVILGVGRGNLDWVNSAPHGAGRILSRGEAKRSINMKDYEESMKNIFTTSVNIKTIDEAPQAYKPIDEIVENIRDTVDIINILKPIYNFKSN